MYKREIESDKQSLSAYIKKFGLEEHIGEAEQSIFQRKVNNNLVLDWSDKCDLCEKYQEMLNSLTTINI